MAIAVRFEEDVAARLKCSGYRAKRAISVVLKTIKERTWTQGKFVIPGFGMFEVRQHKSRKMFDPLRQRHHLLPPALVVFFRPAPNWRTK